MACEAMLLSASSVSRWIARPFRGSWRPGPAAFPLGPDEVLLGIPYIQFSRFMRGCEIYPLIYVLQVQKRKTGIHFCELFVNSRFSGHLFFKIFLWDNYPPYILLHLQNRKTKLQLYELFVNLSLWADLPPHISIGHSKGKNGTYILKNLQISLFVWKLDRFWSTERDLPLYTNCTFETQKRTSIIKNFRWLMCANYLRK